MLALATLLSLFSAILAVDNTVYCDAAVSQLPPTVESVDFTMPRRGHLVPANTFSRGRPSNPHNLPQSFIYRECEVSVDLEAGTTLWCRRGRLRNSWRGLS